jgi:hypothetical protein
MTQEEETMFTLRLIFYGLIAFVPDSSGQGMLAIMPNTAGMVASDGCPLPEHQQVFILREGTCASSNCGDGKIFPVAPQHRFEIEPAYTIPWWEIKDLATMAGGEQPALPDSALETRDVGWIPLLPTVAPGAGGFPAVCVPWPEYCPIQAMFRLHHGTTSVCHLVHTRKEDPVHAFRFKPLVGSASSRPVVQALADAVLVEIPVLGDEVVITATPFDWSGTIQHKLHPDATGRVTLIAANFGAPHMVKAGGSGAGGEPLTSGGERCDATSPARHFEAFYALSEGSFPNESRRVPHALTEEKAPVLYPMTCEADLESLSTYIRDTYLRHLPEEQRKDARVAPHSVEVCGGTRFASRPLDSEGTPEGTAMNQSRRLVPRSAPRSPR